MGPVHPAFASPAARTRENQKDTPGPSTAQVALPGTFHQKEKAWTPNSWPAHVPAPKGLADLNRHWYLSEKARFFTHVSGLRSQHSLDSDRQCSLTHPKLVFPVSSTSPRKNAAGSGMRPKAQMVITVGLRAPQGPTNTDPRLRGASSAQGRQATPPVPCRVRITGGRSGIRATNGATGPGSRPPPPAAQTCPPASPPHLPSSRNPPSHSAPPCSGLRQTPGLPPHPGCQGTDTRPQPPPSQHSSSTPSDTRADEQGQDG